MFYSYDTFDETIPSKDNSYDIDKMLVSFKEQLTKYKELQSDLGVQEKHSFIYTEKLDKRIFNVTIFEIGIIFFAFLVEIIVLRSYLKNKELI